MNLRLSCDRNFAVGVLTMFVIGLALYGSVLLLPVFLQQLLGYTATLAGSTGIAFVTTTLAREMQTHQNLLVHNLTPLNPAYEQAVSGLQTVLTWRGINPTQAHAGVLQILHHALLGQAAIQAYTDVFRLLGVVCPAFVPCMFLLKKIRQGAGGMPAAH